MVQRTVLKVDISCQKCKMKLLKSVSGLKGVDKIEIDGAKGTLTVTGDADPYEIIARVRKNDKCSEVVSVGAPPPPQKKPEEKEPKEKKPEKCHMPQNCPVCERIAFVQIFRRNEPDPSCTIL